MLDMSESKTIKVNTKYVIIAMKHRMPLNCINVVPARDQDIVIQN